MRTHIQPSCPLHQVGLIRRCLKTDAWLPHSPFAAYQQTFHEQAPRYRSLKAFRKHNFIKLVWRRIKLFKELDIYISNKYNNCKHNSSPTERTLLKFKLFDLQFLKLCLSHFSWGLGGHSHMYIPSVTFRAVSQTVECMTLVTAHQPARPAQPLGSE